MSRPLFFLLLLTVAFLAAVASHAGGGRAGSSDVSLRSETRSDVASLKDDMSTIRTAAACAPRALSNFWTAAGLEIKTLETDAAIDARMAARRISHLVKSS